MSSSNSRWVSVSFKQREEGLELPSCKWGTSIHSCWNPKLNIHSHKRLIIHRIQNHFWCNSFIHYFWVSVSVCSHPVNKIIPFFSCLALQRDLTGSTALSPLPCFLPVIFDKIWGIQPPASGRYACQGSFSLLHGITSFHYQMLPNKAVLWQRLISRHIIGLHLRPALLL